MLISYFFGGQRIVSVRSDWSDMSDEFFAYTMLMPGIQKIIAVR